MRKITMLLMVALAALALSATAAFAAVTFDPATGKGFVGKGDVQIAYNLNNKQIQTALIANPQAFTFSVESTDTYSATCTWVTGEGTRGERTHNVDIPRHTALNAAIQGDPRQTSGQKQFTGFNLKGFGATTTTGTVPVVGEPCIAEDSGGIAQNGTWSAVTLVSSTAGVLSVTYNGVTVPLPITPVATTV